MRAKPTKTCRRAIEFHRRHRIPVTLKYRPSTYSVHVTYQCSPHVVRAPPDDNKYLIDDDEPFLPPLCADKWLDVDVDDPSAFETSVRSIGDTDMMCWRTYDSTTSRKVNVIVERRYQRAYRLLVEATTLPTELILKIIKYL